MRKLLRALFAVVLAAAGYLGASGVRAVTTSPAAPAACVAGADAGGGR